MKTNCMINAGELDKKITVEQLTGTADESGHIDESDDANWSTHCERWASFRSAGSREYFKAKQVHADLTHLLRCRFDDTTKSITPKMRIKFNGRILQIKSAVNVDESNVVIEIACVEAL